VLRGPRGPAAHTLRVFLFLMAATRPLIITGGFATGKSTFCGMIAALRPGSVVHDADDCVHGLYAEKSVRSELAALFGQDILLDDGEIDRARVRQEVFASPERRRALEKILHPRVRTATAAAWKQALATDAPFFLADIPLFFEAGQWKPTPDFLVVVVACSPTTQGQRARERNPFDKATVERIVSSQASLEVKMAAADFVAWNEGGRDVLERQAAILADHLAPLPTE